AATRNGGAPIVFKCPFLSGLLGSKPHFPTLLQADEAPPPPPDRSRHRLAYANAELWRVAAPPDLQRPYSRLSPEQREHIMDQEVCCCVVMLSGIRTADRACVQGRLERRL